MAVYTAFLHDQLSVLCIICRSEVSLSDVTPGSLYADGSQAFACSAHMYSRDTWIISWALFDAEQEITNLCQRSN